MCLKTSLVSLLISVTHWLLSLTDLVSLLTNREGISILKCHLRISDFLFISYKLQILTFDLPNVWFRLLLYTWPNPSMTRLIFFLFLFSSNVFSYQWFACSVKVKILIMEDKASKDLDSQFSVFTQWMLAFYRKAYLRIPVCV